MTERETRSIFPSPGQGVYLLDDHELVRRGFRSLLETEGIRVQGESASAPEAIRRIPALRPQLAILDENLPDGTGTAVCRALRAADPSIRCLILSDAAEESTLIAAILSDAWGCLSKQDDNAEQLRLIRRVLTGHTAFSGTFQPILNRARNSPPKPLVNTELSRLTSQELNVVVGLGRGLTNRQIAQSLGLREKTVKNLVTRALAKLTMTRRTQAAVMITTLKSQAVGTNTAPYRHGRSQEAISGVTTTLLDCTKEGTTPVDDAARAEAASALATALTAASAAVKPHPPNAALRCLGPSPGTTAAPRGQRPSLAWSS